MFARQPVKHRQMRPQKIPLWRKMFLAKQVEWNKVILRNPGCEYHWIACLHIGGPASSGKAEAVRKASAGWERLQWMAQFLLSAKLRLCAEANIRVAVARRNRLRSQTPPFPGVDETT
ncbi:hypothetical protein [Agrobacterium sp. DE0009]|uniref:hypothetical protein n=1 Tax=Agrobacterium sp. DE0009 TaxID=2587505 RepID=UPI001FF05A22|nr:hypothetical protein [Agrobacterium sp. DE0009]